MKAHLCVGRIVKPQGIRGEVKVQPLTDDPARFFDLKKVSLGPQGGESMAVRAVRVEGQGVFLTLEGIQDRNAAETLRGVELYVGREDAARLPEGRYYIADLIGMRVADDEGAALGELAAVTQAGGNDVYHVRGQRDFMFPAVKRAILLVDVREGIMMLRAEALREIAVYGDED